MLGPRNLPDSEKDKGSCDLYDMFRYQILHQHPHLLWFDDHYFTDNAIKYSSIIQDQDDYDANMVKIDDDSFG